MKVMDESEKPMSSLETIRVAEFEEISMLLAGRVDSGARILEVGAGAGWQSRELSSLGYSVEAVDVPSGNHTKARIWPVTDYDGVSLPFESGSFDVVYSSNVLEHVQHQKELNSEIQRVLRSGGIAVHYVPSSEWRLASLFAFYPALVKDVFSRFFGTAICSSEVVEQNQLSVADRQRRAFFEKVIHRIRPHAHGAHGTAIGEVKLFGKLGWDSFFKKNNWRVVDYKTNGFFVSGEMIFGNLLSLDARRKLSGALGSSAHLYVLENNYDKD